MLNSDPEPISRPGDRADENTSRIATSDQYIVDNFCYQYLQLEARLAYPDGGLLKRADVQDEIFRRICRDDELEGGSPPSNARFQLRTLKELARIIQENIGDEEADEYVCDVLVITLAGLSSLNQWLSFQEVSDSIMSRIGHLMSMPQVPEDEEVQLKTPVTYRLSLLQAPVQVDILENRRLIAAGGTTGLRTWEAALHLGQYLCANNNLVAGQRVLELGAGTGYLSIVCAKCLGAAHVIATDGSEEVVDNLSDNFTLNNTPWGYNASPDAIISPKLLKWGHALVGTEEAEWNGGRKVDLIIGADITYDKKVIPSLVATLKELLELYPHAGIIISATERNLDTLLAFQDACALSRLTVSEHHFSVDEARAALYPGRVDEPSTPFYASNIPIRIFHIGAEA